MVIDFHTHTFPDKIAEKAISSLAERSHSQPYTNGTLLGLFNSMERGGVTGSVILPVVTNPVHTTSVNDVAIKTNEAQDYNSDRYVISFGGMHPDTSDYKTELNRLVEHGIKGIKLHPNYQDTDIDDIRYLRIIEHAASLGLMISIHAGIDIGLPEPIYASPDKLLHVYEETKADQLVFAHTGSWKMWDEVEAKLVGLPVYFDTAFTFDYIDAEQMKRIISNHGADKILFATDSPWSDPGRDIKALKGLKLDAATEDAILYKNACRILNI